MASIFDDIFAPAPKPSTTGQVNASPSLQWLYDLLKMPTAATGTSFPNAQRTDITQMPTIPAAPKNPWDYPDPYADFGPTPSPPPLTNTGLPQIAPPPVQGLAQTPAITAPPPQVQPALMDNLANVRDESRGMSTPRYAGGTANFNETTGQYQPVEMSLPVIPPPPMSDSRADAWDMGNAYIPPPPITAPVQTTAPTQTDTTKQLSPEAKLTGPVTTTTNTSTGAPTTPTPTPTGTPLPPDNLNEVRNESRAQSQPPTPPPVPTLSPITGSMPTTPLPAVAGQPGVNRVDYTKPEVGPVQPRRELTPIEYTPTQAGPVQDRRDLPTAPNLEQGNVGNYLANQGIGDTNLPTVPQNRVGTFEEYLTKNNLQMLTPEQISEQAKRVREMQTGEAISRTEQERLAAQQRNQLAQSQAGTGLDTMLNDLDNSLRKQIEYITAQNMQRGLTTSNSNIPVERDFNPLLYNYAQQRGSLQQSVQDKINQLRLEGQITDQQAAQALIDLERQGGLVESQTMSDLQARERQFGEQARQSRFGEFAGIEDINRSRDQDTFGNQAQLAGLSEAIRSGRVGEFFQQAGLNQGTSQQNFANEAQLSGLTEQLRQNDISANLAKQQQGLQEYQVRSGVENDLTRLTEQMRQGDITNNQQALEQALQEYSTRSGVSNDLTRLQDQLSNSTLERALATRQGELEGDPNSLVNKLKAAQTQEAQARAQAALAQAQSGGFSADDQYTITSNIGTQIAALPALITNKTITPAAAKTIIAEGRFNYDRIRGAGAFDRIYGGLVKAIESGQTGDPAETGGVFEANKKVAQQRTSVLDKEIADAEAHYAANANNPSWFGTWGPNFAKNIAEKKAERDGLKQKYGL